jgi:hypothetical protein
MFLDSRFKCKTIYPIKHEFSTSPNFIDKYPWRGQYKPKITAIGNITNEDADFNLALETIKVMIKNSARNSKTGKIYDLSYEDKRVAATVIAHNYFVSTEDNDLTDILEQHFEKTNLTPLYLLNNWIEEGLIIWDDQKHALMKEWKTNDEPPQPANEIERFQKLTGRIYPGL